MGGDASARGRANRAKGQRFERWVVGELRGIGFEHARRGLQAAGAVVADVEGVPGWWIECQSATRPTPGAKLEQARRDAAEWTRRNPDEPPRVVVVLAHRSGAPLDSTEATLWCDAWGCYATISISDWLRMVAP